MTKMGIRLILATLFLSVGWSNGYLHESIIFPIRYVDHSIDLGISDDELKVQSGRCMNTRNEFSLILPRSCAPSSLYSGFIASNSVTCLSLRDNLIEHVTTGSFDCLPNLRYLDLSKNRIGFCDLLSFRSHNRLKTLIVDENAMSVGDSQGLTLDSSSYFPSVEHLYLRNNHLMKITFSLRRNFPSLSHLYLSDNCLDSESLNELELPTCLRHLHLERNNVRRVESQLVRNLYFLFLDGNEIGKICATDCWGSFVSVRGAVNLRFLSLSRNEIAHIARDSFAEACNLRTLSLSHNNLEIIVDGTFDWLRELQDLSLSHNRLRCLPKFDFTTKLTILSLDRNEIERIESNAFRGLAFLKWISLSSNRISVVENGAFRDLRALEELDLSDNQLSCLSPDWIGTNTRLRLLDLRGNRFTSFHYLYLEHVYSLADLYFQGNPLSSFDSPPYGTFYRNVSVHVDRGITFSPIPCYVICDFERQTIRRYSSDNSI